MIYLDYASSSPMDAKALNVLVNSNKEDFANPHSPHKKGRELKKKIENVRQYFLEVLNTNGYFVFTSSATESNNTVIQGIPANKGDSFFYSPTDHPSITAPCLSRDHIELYELPMTKGQVDINKLIDNINHHTKLILLTHVNSQSGYVSNVFEVAAAVKRKHPSLWIHVDAAQSFGKYPLNLKHIDSLAISSHKIAGPKGIAGLYLKSRIIPLLHGGGQENGLRSSTVSPSLIFSFKTAMTAMMKDREKKILYVQTLNSLAKKLLKEIPGLIFPFDNCTPYILSFIVPSIPADILLRQLEERELFVSTTSACSSRIKKNPVLSALGIEETYHKHVLRISFSHRTTKNEIAVFCHELKEIHRENLDMLNI